MDSKKVEVRPCKIGNGLFAKEEIQAGEPIAAFDGATYTDEFDSADHLNYYLLQIGEGIWQDAAGVARYANHSCDPNCGIQGLNQIVAMKKIAPNEEITFDYEMTEETWEMEDGVPYFMECQCGSPICRKKIGSFKNLPQHIRDKYKGFISSWLVKKYEL